MSKCKHAVSCMLFIAAVAAEAQWLETTIDVPDSFCGLTRPQGMVYDSLNNAIYIGGFYGDCLVALDGTSNRKIARVPVGTDVRRLCCNPQDNKVYCANAQSNTVSIVDGATKSLRATVPVGDYPYDLCWNSRDDKVYCANLDGSTVSVIHGALDSVVATIAVEGPQALCYNSHDNKVYCAPARYDTSGLYYSVSVIDASADTVVAHVRVGECEPEAILYNSVNNRVYCASYECVSVIDGATDSVVAIIPGGDESVQLAFSAPHNEVYCSNYYRNRVTVIDCGSDTVLATVQTGIQPYALCYNSTADAVCVANDSSNTITVIDCANHRVIATIPVGCKPSAIGYNPRNNRVYSVNRESDNVSVIDGAANSVLATVVTGQIAGALCYNTQDEKLYCASERGSYVTVVDGVTNEVLRTVRTSAMPHALCYNEIDNKVYCASWDSAVVTVIACPADTPIARLLMGGTPVDLCFNPRDDKIYCATSDRNWVMIIDGETNVAYVHLDVGRSPRALCYSSVGNKIYCANQASHTVSVIDGSADIVVATVPVGRWPYVLCYNSRDNRIYCSDEAGVTVIDGASDTVVARLSSLGTTFSFCYNDQDDKVYCANGDHVTVVDGAADTVVATVSVAEYAWSLLYSPLTNKVYCAHQYIDSVTVIDGVTNQVDRSFSVGKEPWHLCLGPTYSRVYVGNYYGSSLSVLRDSGLSVDVAVERICEPAGCVRYDSLLLPCVAVRNRGLNSASYTAWMRVGTSYRDSLAAQIGPLASDTLRFAQWRARPAGWREVVCSTYCVADTHSGNNVRRSHVSVDSGSGPLVVSVSPDYGGNMGLVSLDIKGHRLDEDLLYGPVVRLRRAGQPELVPVYRELVDSTCILAEFDLDSCSVGRWDVVVKDQTGDSALAPEAFTVEPCRECCLFDILGRDRIRFGTTDVWRVVVKNRGNVDFQPSLLSLFAEDSVQLVRVARPDGWIVWDRDSLIDECRTGQDSWPELWLGAPEGIEDSVTDLVPHFIFPTVVRGTDLELLMHVYCPQPPEVSDRAFKPGKLIANLTKGVKSTAGVSSYVTSELVQNLVVNLFAQTSGSVIQEAYEIDPDYRHAVQRGVRRALVESFKDLVEGGEWLDTGSGSVFRLTSDVLDDCNPVLAKLQRCGLTRDEAVDVVTSWRISLSRKGVRTLKDFRSPRKPRGLGKNGIGLLFFGADIIGETYLAVKEGQDRGLTKTWRLERELRLSRVRSMDPNDKLGPRGSDSLRHCVLADEPFDFTIRFENVDTATAEAESIAVVDRLDANLDWPTLVLDSVSHPQCCTTLLDSVNRTVTWVFRDINLPPNKHPPEGEGWCRFNVAPRSGLPTGTETRNCAHIYFDYNPPINTDTVLNTLDAGAPISSVRALPETTATAGVTLHWSARDDSLGSGVDFVTLLCRTDSTGWGPWLVTCGETTAVFTGANETRYYFCSQATDKVGHTEALPNSADAVTFVTGIEPPEMFCPRDTGSTPAADTTPLFAWTATAGEQGRYTLQYSPDSAFTQQVVALDSLSSPHYVVPDSAALSDTTWYARVEAVGVRGAHSGYSAPIQYVVDAHGPPAVTLLLPPNGATVTDSMPVLTWSSSRTGEPVEYLLFCTTDSLTDSMIAGSVRTSDTTFTVPGWAALNDATHYWFVRAVDRAGNASPDPIPFRFTTSTLRMISGKACYYADTDLPIPDAKVVLSGTMQDTVLTDAAGNYLLTDLTSRESYAVAPERQNAAREPAVSAFDAALSLRHAARIDTFEGLQFTAGDVSGDSTVSAFDAALVLQYAVGRIQHFPVGHRPGLDTVDWDFVPPVRTYDTLRMNMGDQDYTGILFGDPSGNWTNALPMTDAADDSPAGYFSLGLPETEGDAVAAPAYSIQHAAYRAKAEAQSSPKPQAASLKPESPSPQSTAVPTTKTQRHQDTESVENSVSFPVSVKAVRNALSADMLVRYDARRYTLNAIRLTPETAGWMVAAMDRAGEVRIAMAGAEPLNGDVNLLELEFRLTAEGAENAEGTQTSFNHESTKSTAARAEGPRANTQMPSPEASILTTKTQRHQEAQAQAPGPSSELHVRVEPPAVGRQPLAEIVWLVINENGRPGATPAAENAMGERKDLPAAFYLGQPMPNPFGTGTVISYGLPFSTRVDVGVFDATGRLVRILAKGQQSAGRYSVVWNGKDGRGRQLASGIYFVRMQSDEFNDKRKVTLLRQ